MIQNLDWWLFLALAPVVYWLAPLRIRAGLLAGISLAIVLAMAPFEMTMMLGLALLVYGVFALQDGPAVAAAGRLQALLPKRLSQARRSTWLFLIVLIYLFWYKYTPQLAFYLMKDKGLADLVPPIGISYFSFKLMHYALERGRGTLPAHTIQTFLCWMFLMPTFTSGPIERFDHFLHNTETRFRIGLVVEGGTRIVQGLVKRFVLVDQLARVAGHYTGPDLVAFAHGMGGQQGAFAVWAYLAIALIVLYLDFSAYSDMAIGVCRLFGFRIMENFDYPLLAPNLTEFWRRWHMSLTNWCRAYVYMPVIGLTRNPYTAVIATFVLVGLWHAGTIHWLAWGLWHGVGQAISLHWARFAQRRKITFFKTRTGKVAGWALTMAYVMLGGSLVAFYHAGRFLDSFWLMGRAFGG